MLAVPTETEINLYQDFVRQQLQPHIQLAKQNMPSMLFHYTGGDSLIKIIKSGSLWATHVSCVNDQLELRYGQSLLLQAFRKLKETEQLSNDESFLIEILEQRLSEDRTNTSDWFITCFSAKEDDLSQWRAYGAGEGGYAIGFKVSQLVQNDNLDTALLAPVCYDTMMQNKIADAVARKTLNFFSFGLQTRIGQRTDWTEAFLNHWNEAVTYIAPLIKHPKFAEEAEWRLVRRLRDTDIPNMIYVQKKTLLSRHLSLKLKSDLSEKILPIGSIRIGPSRNKHVSRVSVADLLRTYGYQTNDVNILETEAPFQVV
jgi:hypothetical protein